MKPNKSGYEIITLKDLHIAYEATKGSRFGIGCDARGFVKGERAELPSHVFNDEGEE